MTDITARPPELSAQEKRAVLAQLLAKKAQKEKGPASALPRLVPAPQDRYKPFPLTDAQYAYWIGRTDLLELGNVACHAYFDVDLRALDLPRLEAAWQSMIERHEMLRAIVRPDGQQQILEHVPRYQLEVLDLRGQDPAIVEARLMAIREHLSHQVLPPDQWPLFEFRASLLDDQLTRLHLSMDVLILDFGCLQTLMQDWFQVYQDPDCVLPPIDISFRDYVLAEEAFRDSELYRRSQEYWLNRLDTLPPPPDFPVAKSPSAVKKPRFVRRRGRLEPETWQRLKQRTAAAGLTASSVTMAAFSEVLALWTGSPRFTLNLTLFNRLNLHPQIKHLIGDFTSVDLLEVDNSGEEAFVTRARRIQKQVWDDLDHRYFGGIRVMRELARVRGGASKLTVPVVFTSFLTEETAVPVRDVVSLALVGEPVYSISQTPQVWLDHQVLQEGGALIYQWDAVEELFPAGMLDDMHETQGRLLQRLADDDQAWNEPIRDLLPPAQRRRRELANATEGPVPDGLLQTRFLEQVERAPHHPAVVAGGETLSYEELYRRSATLGHHLRQLGARPNTLVAVVMEKGWEQVVAVMAILQSGAAYLPLDPDLPRERLWWLLDNAEAALALTHSHLDERLEWPDGVRRLCVDRDEPGDWDGRPLTPVQTPDDLAYVIYTSGSTGTPKGVMIDHRSALNTIVDLNERFAIGPADRVLAISALSFDLSVYDLFGLLAAGGTIVMPESAAARDPARWLELLEQERVTLWSSVPQLMQMLVDYTAGRSATLPDSLRLVWLSGDWIPVTLPDEVRALAPGARVISMGGPTETSIWSIIYPIETVDPGAKSIPYGKPLLNRRMYVLNEALEDCPDWVPGPIYTGGLGLAKGYWRDEEKTQANFLIHPRTGERLYRTGDLGRYLPDGNIEILGREDFQVKIQGNRIELGEIEAALQDHPAVRMAVASAVGEPRGRKRLVAYVVPEQTERPSANGPASLAEVKPSDDYLTGHLNGVTLLDPVERLEFKLRRPGLRSLSGADSIALPKPQLDEAFIAGYTARRSEREFLREPIPFERFGEFLTQLYSIDLDGLPKHRYASADGVYPVQVYLHFKPGAVEGIAPGAYYYHPAEHRLVLLSSDASIDRELHWPHNRALFDAAAFSLFLVGQLGAVAPLYGDLARDFCVLEAGYIGQLLMTAAPASEIGLCAIGDLEFDRIRHHFALDESHLLVHSLVGGRLDPNRSPGWSRVQQPIAELLPTRPAGGQPSGTNGLAGELRDFLRRKLPEYMLPTAFVVLDSLPLTANGKVDRRALPDPEQLSAGGQHRAPSTPTEQLLADLWAEVLGRERIGVDDNFFEVGGDSLLAVQLIAKATESGLELNPRELFQHQTIAELAALIDQAARSAPDGQPASAAAAPRSALPPTLVEIQPGSAERPLFLVHPSSGNVECYFELVRQLSPARAVFGFQSVGLDGAEPPLAEIEAMAAHHLQALGAVQPSGPYLLVGWSMGGLVAFEMARQLEERGQRVDRLILLDIGVTDFSRQPAAGDAELAASILADHLPFSLEQFRRLEPDGQLDFVLEQATAASLVPSGLDRERLRPYIEVSHANLQAARRYHPRPYAGRVVLFQAGERPAERIPDPHLGWDELALGGVEADVTPGSHFTILKPPQVEILAGKLRAHLADPGAG